jgi:hypothetical protein
VKVTTSVGFSLEKFDFVVNASEEAGWDRAVPSVEDSLAVRAECPRELHKLLDASRFEHRQSSGQRRVGSRLVQLLPDVLKGIP